MLTVEIKRDLEGTGTGTAASASSSKSRGDCPVMLCLPRVMPSGLGPNSYIFLLSSTF